MYLTDCDNMTGNRQAVYSELAALRALPPLGKNLSVLCWDLNQFREYMDLLGTEFRQGLIVYTGGAELNLLESISRTIVSEFGKDCGVVPVETLRGWRLEIEEWRRIIQYSNNPVLHPDMSLDRTVDYSSRITQMEISFKHFQKHGIEALRQRSDLYQLSSV